MKRLAIISSHPIQYNSPLFRFLTERGNILLKVFYTLEPSAVLFDRDFGKEIKWDLPLLEGYEYTFISNGGINRKDFWSVKNPTLEKEISNWMPDMLLVFGWNYFSHLRAMRFFKGKIPVLFRGDSTLIDDRPGFRAGLRNIFLRWVYSYVDIAVYAGVNNRAYFKAVGFKDKNLIFAPHAIDNNRFSKAANSFNNEALSFRRNLGIGPDQNVFLFAGKFQQKKNPLILLNAFIDANTPDSHLIFVGDGLLKDEIENLSSGKPNVHILPFQNQSRMPLIYQICDIFCLPSQGPGETWGLSVNEAMACGKAILVSDKVGCAFDLVKDHVNGFIFKSGDKDDLKLKILAFSDRKTTLNMGERSKNIVEKYSYAGFAEGLEKII